MSVLNGGLIDERLRLFDLWVDRQAKGCLEESGGPRVAVYTNSEFLYVGLGPHVKSLFAWSPQITVADATDRVKRYKNGSAKLYLYDRTKMRRLTAGGKETEVPVLRLFDDLAPNEVPYILIVPE